MTAAEAKSRIITPEQKEQSRFWSKVRFSDGCWEWIGAIHENGYGAFRCFRSQVRPAHRVSFEYAHGRISGDRVIDHLCANKRCVNPNHLEAATHQDNIGRMPRFNVEAL